MLTEDEVNALRAKHGRIKRVVFNGHELVFRKPSRAECIQHMQMTAGPDKHMADEMLAQLIVVHPSKESFSNLTDEWPYMCQSGVVSNAIGQLAGIVQDEESKNLRTASSGSGSSGATSPPA